MIEPEVRGGVWRGILASGLAAVGGCRSGPVPGPAPAAAAAGAGRLERLVRVFGPDGRETALAEAFDAAAGADVVFIGETHLDEVTHDVELAVLEELIRRRDGRVVLAMEMFATDAQPALDAYLAGRIDDAEFQRRAEPWRNYRTGYRPLIETAKDHGVPVVGSNIPASLRREIAGGGREAFEALDEPKRRLVPPVLHPNSRAYWQRFFRAVAGHMGAGGGGDPDPQALLYSSQSLWDNTMGWSCAQALERHPGSVVVHVNGAFHSEYRQGAVQQLMRRRPDARVVTITVLPARDLNALDTRGAGEVADYLVFAEHRARGVQEGFLAVTAQREVRYRLHVPEDAGAASPVPLLVWLSQEGVRATDVEQYWQAALGDEAAVVTVEPPSLEIAEDLHAGGRWYRTETFHSDVSTVVQALERIVPYVTQRFAVSPSAVAVAGAGTGATVVAAAAMETDRLAVRAIAVAPRETSRMIERTLPDFPPATIDLTVLDGPGAEPEWTARLAGYRDAGLAARFEAGTEDAYAAAERRVREALGLPPAPPPSAGRVALVLGTDTAPARQWARNHARRLRRDGRNVEITTPEALDDVTAGPPAELRALALPGEWPAAGDAAPPELDFLSVSELDGARDLPVAAGPFGGTTLVVVPAGAPPQERDAWRQLRDSDAMEEVHGRFHHLALAFEDEEPGLGEALEALNDARRRNVLIVPAAFCAGADFMRNLEAQARPYGQQMTIAWLPGLGGAM